MSKRILVTGASGFVGQHVLPMLLEQNYEVHATSHLTLHRGPVYTSNVTWWPCDLFNKVRVEQLLHEIQPEYLMHLAWDVSASYLNSLSNLKWVDASINLLQCFAKGFGRRSVVAGTGFEYDKSSLYGVCKSNLHEILNVMNLPTEIIWARLFYLYGPYEKPNRLVPHVINKLLVDEPISIRTIENAILPYMYVGDTARSLVNLLEYEDLNYDTVNLAGEYIGVGDLVRKIAALMEKSETYLTFGTELPADVSRKQQEDRCIDSFVGRISPNIGFDRGLIETIKYWKDKGI